MNISDYGKLLAFDMEEVLRRRGANLIVCTKETRTEALTLVNDVDHRLVTGAFASSAKWVSQQMLTALQIINDHYMRLLLEAASARRMTS